MVVKEDADMEDMDYIIRGKVTNILVECRKEKGVTQRELADAMGSKETTVASWEQGKSLPSIQMLYKLARYYNKTIGYMYGEEVPYEDN
jgi:putative transcriptional regulator